MNTFTSFLKTLLQFIHSDLGYKVEFYDIESDDKICITSTSTLNRNLMNRQNKTLSWVTLRLQHPSNNSLSLLQDSGVILEQIKDYLNDGTFPGIVSCDTTCKTSNDKGTKSFAEIDIKITTMN